MALCVMTAGAPAQPATPIVLQRSRIFASDIELLRLREQRFWSYLGDKTTVLADLFPVIRQRAPVAKRPNLKRLTRRDDSAWAF